MAVSKRLRYEILRRDNHACRYCGATAPGTKLAVDHVIPQSLGGGDAPTNLVTACAGCNAGKTSSMPNAMPVADVDQATFRQAAELRQGAEQRRTALFVHLHMVWAWAWEKTGHPISDRDEEFFAEETHKLLDCGWSAHTDLTEAAFRAGSQNAVDIASYIGRIVRASPVPPSAADQRFVTCVDAINEWECAWDSASDQGTPPGDVVSRFIDAVGAAFDSGVNPAQLVRAAEATGRAMSTDLDKHLAELITAGGEG
ncbi:HNH endonuclease [Streptomyces antimycoticus]|uniref:HNH endonuclease n=1 Tax=Streptomyces antimycoticus TaxID=68175 RepID=UPI003864CEFD|nr:HNH endonuclease [Streptomyces antimycoticus]